MYTPLPDDALSSRISTGYVPAPEEVELLVRQAFARCNLASRRRADHVSVGPRTDAVEYPRCQASSRIAATITGRATSLPAFAVAR